MADTAATGVFKCVTPFNLQQVLEHMAELHTDGGETDTTCRVCGDAITKKHTHRVVTAVEDGQTTYDHFCTDDCLEAWVE